MMNTKKSPSSHLYKYAFVLPIVVGSYFVIHALNIQPLHAQGKKVSDVSAQNFKPFEGYYQFQKDKEYFLEIESKEDGLLLKELWTGNEIPFTPISEMEFLNSEKKFPLKFTKGSDGSITQVLAFNRDLWDKVKEYKPVIHQAITLTPKHLKAFEGYYQFEKNQEAYLQFTAKGNGLIAKQLWDGKEFFILPESPLEFFSQKEKYPASFTKDENGTVTQVLVFKRDVWKKVKDYTPRTEVKLSQQKLKAFEGRYTFQFEPGKDEFLQITAKDDHLILKEAWTGNEIKFVAVSELEFLNKGRAFPLKFTKNNTGTVTHVLAFNRDLWTKVKE